MRIKSSSIIITTMNIFTLIFLAFFSCINSEAQYYKKYFDGPYITVKNDSLQLQWVEAGAVTDTLLAKSQADVFKRPNLPMVDLQDLDFEIDDQVYYDGVQKFAAISDIHGQYDIMIELLRAHEIIDNNNNWQYGNGHLVVVGDNLDRGDKMVDILWTLFNLQKQAQKAGGKVHVLVGNHEKMVLSGDLRYLNRKYAFTAGALQTPYNQFFKKGSVLGDWIASHKVAISINNTLFVHGGLSPRLAKSGLTLEEVNQTFREKITRSSGHSADPMIDFLSGDDGPLWYRGYFRNADSISSVEIDSILDTYGQNLIVVGHTSQSEITTLHDESVIALDCSIKLGKTGQMLLFKNGAVYKGEIDGSKSLMIDNSENKPSLFEALYEHEGKPMIKVTTDYGRLKGKRMKEEYQPALFEWPEKDLILSGRVRSRGNVRKKVCRVPPVKFDFDKSSLDSAGYYRNDKLKMVWPCKERDLDQEMLYKEYFLYGLYNLIEPHGLRAKLVDVQVYKDKKDKVELDEEFTALLVEDEDEYARRKNARVIETGKIMPTILDRESFLKMVFFQYMISNTDWSITTKHNIEMVKIADVPKILALPYDFDYAGFVGQKYAVPHESLPIRTVHNRYFFKYEVTLEEAEMAIKYYQEKQDEIIAYCRNATYMNENTIKDNIKYLMEFFDDINEKPDKIIKSLKIKE